jgi:hypothetical protein
LAFLPLNPEYAVHALRGLAPDRNGNYAEPPSPSKGRTLQRQTPAKDHMITQHGGDTAPDFTVATQSAMISLHEWAGNSWAFRFGHPADCTP